MPAAGGNTAPGAILGNAPKPATDKPVITDKPGNDKPAAGGTEPIRSLPKIVETPK
jgi:hypothetical protein